MKNYRIKIWSPEDTKPMLPKDIFLLSDYLSEFEMKECLDIKESVCSIEQKLEQIQWTKNRVMSIFNDSVLKAPLGNYFHVDGAIIFNEEDMIELEKSFVKFDSNGKKEDHQKSTYFETYMLSLVADFTYFHSKGLIFRNPKFYFLFPSITIDRKDRFSSINDFNITDINISDFIKDFLEHYNSIDQNLLLFSTHFNESLRRWLIENVSDFSREVANLLTTKELKNLRKKLKVVGNIWNNEIDSFHIEEWNIAIDRLEIFGKMVNQFSIHKTPDLFSQIVTFISEERQMFEYAKNTFGIDIDSVFNKYSQIKVTRSMRKVVLGLLDAKINMLAFMQNITQILSNNQFLDQEFDGNLIFNRDTVRNIKKTCFHEFVAFKKQQERIQSSWQDYELLSMLDSHVGYFMEILLETSDIASVKSTGNIPNDLPEITEWKTDMMRDELKEGIDLMESFLRLIEKYKTIWEIEPKKRNKEGDPHRITRETKIREKALNKLIRPYREENDPLVMIKTAQNALNMIIQKWFNPNQDILHVMGVNYGGTLVWLYAKYVFSKTVNKGQVLSNVWNIIYSLYDVKNANSFLELTDYPLAEIMRNVAIDDNTKKYMSSKNWLLIFDDNTNSWETLDNLRIKAKESGFYGNIDVFACRASHRLENYKKTLTDEEKLDFIIHSAISSRKTVVNPKNQRYKELLGTIVGSRINKILGAT